MSDETSSPPPYSELTEAERGNMIANLLMSGFNDDLAREQLGWTFEEFTAAKRALYERETAALKSRTNYDHYLDYFFAQRAIINDFQMIAQRVAESGRPEAAVGPLGKMSDIIDRVLKVGQDLGVIDRKAMESKTLNLHGFGTLEDLKASFMKERKAVEALLAGAGGMSMADVVVPVIHRPDPKKLTAPEVIDAEVVSSAPKKKVVKVVKRAAPAA